MAIIGSIGTKTANHVYSQQQIKQIVQAIFDYPERKWERLLPVFDHAKIEKRQFAVDKEWLMQDHRFPERNELYIQHALLDSLDAIDACLNDPVFLKEKVPFEAIDMLIFVSSTGIATPSIDARIMNARPFRSDMRRMPLWGLGCAGGAMGLAHAKDWLAAHPDKTCLVICCEMCSLTFQKNDDRKSNLIGTALFGDGTSAVLLIGSNSPYSEHLQGCKPRICNSSTLTQKNSEDIMGWEITETGLKVIFSKSIPSLVQSVWKKHIFTFLKDNKLEMEKIHSFVAHPGGAKVLEAMEEVTNAGREKFRYSYKILAEHGNMSSTTVHFVLKKWMEAGVTPQEKSILSALGPGFSSELLLLEWN